MHTHTGASVHECTYTHIHKTLFGRKLPDSGSQDVQSAPEMEQMKIQIQKWKKMGFGLAFQNKWHFSALAIGSETNIFVKFD